MRYSGRAVSLSTQQFLTGDMYGEPALLAGELPIPKPSTVLEESGRRMIGGCKKLTASTWRHVFSITSRVAALSTPSLISHSSTHWPRGSMPFAHSVVWRSTLGLPEPHCRYGFFKGGRGCRWFEHCTVAKS